MIRFVTRIYRDGKDVMVNFVSSELTDRARIEALKAVYGIEKLSDIFDKPAGSAEWSLLPYEPIIVAEQFAGVAPHPHFFIASSIINTSALYFIPRDVLLSATTQPVEKFLGITSDEPKQL